MRDRSARSRITGELKRLPRFRRRRACRRSIGLSGAIGVALLGAPLLAHPVLRLVYNGSASAPIGFYSVGPAEGISRGDLVLAKLPDAARLLAAERGYLPEGVPVVKHVAALAGDFVCANSGIVVINNRVAADTLLIDRQGRPLPAWNGCRAITQGEVFLLNEGARASFDGRYFGPIDGAAILGKLVPLWTW